MLRKAYDLLITYHCMNHNLGLPYRYEVRKRHTVPDALRLSGLEPLLYEPKKSNMRETFLMIGERCNVAGSSIYKKAIVDGNYDKAASIATKQVATHYSISHDLALQFTLNLICD